MLLSEQIEVWSIRLPVEPAMLRALEAVLSEDEVRRMARYRTDDRRASAIVARGALRVLLGKYVQLDPMLIRFSYSENGKPFLEQGDVAFNVSHSGDWVVLAFGLKRRLGVDVERIAPRTHFDDLLERCFLPKEIAQIKAAADPLDLFFRFWVKKEAYVKACGSTLFQALKLDFSEEMWQVLPLDIATGYAAAVVTDRPVKAVEHHSFGEALWEN